MDGCADASREVGTMELTNCRIGAGGVIWLARGDAILPRLNYVLARDLMISRQQHHSLFSLFDIQYSSMIHYFVF